MCQIRKFDPVDVASIQRSTRHHYKGQSSLPAKELNARKVLDKRSICDVSIIQ
jgi:hypothetical protein